MLAAHCARARPLAHWRRTIAFALTSASSASRSLSTTQPLGTTTTTTHTFPTRDGTPLRLAVIGSGPAGFYTAYRAMSKIQDIKVDMYEALPVPFGLVRFGVAPDHPEVKVSTACRGNMISHATPLFSSPLTHSHTVLVLTTPFPELPGKV